MTYLELVKKRLPWLLLISAAAALIAYGVVARVKPQYEVHYAYVISLAQREAPQEYRFDGFYALQATDLFSATLASWITAPEVIVEAYEQAGLPLPSEDVREIAKAVKAEKTAPQLVQVTVKHESKSRAEALAAALKTVVDKRVEEYHDQGTPAVAFRVVADTAWTGIQRISVSVIVVATFVFAFLFLLNAVLLMESVKRLS